LGKIEQYNFYTTYPRSDCQYLPISQLSEVKDVMTAISNIDSNMGKLIVVTIFQPKLTSTLMFALNISPLALISMLVLSYS
jgi:hypothetical protein